MLDRTASMQAADSRRRALAREPGRRCRRSWPDLGPDDRAALDQLLLAQRGPVRAAPPEAVSRLLKDLKPAFGGGKLWGTACHWPAKLCPSAGADILSTLYVVSDLQSAACGNLAGRSGAAQDLEVRALPVGDVITPNLAVAALQLDSRDGENRLMRSSPSIAEEEAKSVKMKLVVDDKEVFSRPVALVAPAT